MKWKVVYFEQENTIQPAEVFEDALDITNPQLSGKLLQVTDALKYHGYRLGGGYIEKCHNYEGMWEIRVIYNGALGREFFGFDKERIVLLHGYVKRTGQRASEYDLNKAFGYWKEYLRTCHISPVQEEENG
ncbi:MAG: type II toxin-antitoxin system RelE/ParE family toxin [Ktedonobacteraceae bacterium]